MHVTANAPPHRLTAALDHEIEKIQGSRFLTTLVPCETVDLVIEEQARLRAAHPHSRHVCYAYVGATDLDTRFSDDGEPSKTAGLPMLKVLLGASMRNTGALVVRYFGGVKLGTGGLVRAYTQATREALDLATKELIVEHCELWVSVDYAAEPRLRHEVQELGASIVDAQYAGDVQLHLRLPVALVEQLHAKVGETSPCRGHIRPLN